MFKNICLAMLAISLLLLQACTSVPIPVEKTLQLQAAGKTGNCRYNKSTESDTMIVGPTLMPSGEIVQSALLLSNGIVKEIGSPIAIKEKYPSANRLECTSVLITPGLINAHEHIPYSFAAAPDNLAPVYAHRDEWRVGQNGKPKLEYAPSKDPAIIAMNEMRHLLHGETVVAGPGGVPGLIKNVSSPRSETNIYVADTQVFPLGTNVNNLFGNAACEADPAPLGPPKLSPDAPKNSPFVPHVGEGTNCAAKLEIDDYLNYVKSMPGRKYSLIHAVMLNPSHLPGLTQSDVSVVWSPRSNLALYGKTLDPTWLLDAGVNIGLGTDWSLSGSYDMLEEMRCARSANQASGARKLSGVEIIHMATQGSAQALGLADKIGILEVGKVADIAIFDDTNALGTEQFGNQDNAAMIAVFIDGNLIAGDVQQLTGAIPSNCQNTVAGKFVCQDFSQLPFTFEKLVAASSGKVNLIGTSGQAKCGK